MRGLFTAAFNKVRKYPHWQRRPYILMLVFLMIWTMYTSNQPMRISTEIALAALFMGSFLTHRGRAFWFCWGIAAGLGLVDIIAKWQPHLAR
jgi:membrane-associated phospholipid phosphatase